MSRDEQQMFSLLSGTALIAALLLAAYWSVGAL
jgi:hypothetical protein